MRKITTIAPRSSGLGAKWIPNGLPVSSAAGLSSFGAQVMSMMSDVMSRTRESKFGELHFVRHGRRPTHQHPTSVQNLRFLRIILIHALLESDGRKLMGAFNANGERHLPVVRAALLRVQRCEPSFRPVLYVQTTKKL